MTSMKHAIIGDSLTCILEPLVLIKYTYIHNHPKKYYIIEDDRKAKSEAVVDIANRPGLGTHGKGHCGPNRETGNVVLRYHGGVER